MTDTISIQEGNRLIAEELGWRFEIIDSEFGGELLAYYNNQIKWRGQKPAYLEKFLVEGLNYHEDYNRLMLAAQKICNMGYTVQWTITDGATCRIWSYLKTVPSCCIIKDRPWFAIVEFFQWYNTNNSK